MSERTSELHDRRKERKKGGFPPSTNPPRPNLNRPIPNLEPHSPHPPLPTRPHPIRHRRHRRPQDPPRQLLRPRVPGMKSQRPIRTVPRQCAVVDARGNDAICAGADVLGDVGPGLVQESGDAGQGGGGGGRGERDYVDVGFGGEGAPAG